MRKILCVVLLICSMSAVADKSGYLKGTNTVTLAEGETLILLSIFSEAGNPGGIYLKVEFPPYDAPEPNIYNIHLYNSTDIGGRTILGPCRLWTENKTGYDFVSYKITSGAVYTYPMNVITLPAEDNSGDVDLLVETSTDLQTWTPVYSGSAGTSGSAAFIRTRLVKP